MMQVSQLSLFDPPPVEEPDYTDCATIAERFEAFHHQRNPQVYEALRDMALQLRARGHQKYGIEALFEVLRFNAAM